MRDQTYQQRGAPAAVVTNASTARSTMSENETATQLVRIWQELLGVEAITLDQNYFDLGGDSSLAVRLFVRIEAVFHVKLPLATLYEAPTIEELARVIRSAASPSSQSKPFWSSLVPFSTEGTRQPLFLMHSHGGNVLEYRALVQRLGKERPLYGLQARGLDGNLLPESRIEEMASHYLREMRSVQPHGPYYLGGFCFGGFLALEAAQQLRAQNEDVPLVIMINAATKSFHYPPSTGRARRILYSMSDRFGLEFDNLSRKPSGMMFTHLLARGRRLRDVVQSRAEMLFDKLHRNRDVRNHSMIYHLERLAMLNDHAWEIYDPKQYEGNVLLLYAGRQPVGIPRDPKLGWNGLLTGEFQTQEVPGFRQNMLDEPSVEALAVAIMHAIHHCEAKET